MDFNQKKEELEECILRIRQGDKEAFEQLYRCTENYIYYCIAREGLPKQAVVDVMQEVYLAVYEGLDSLRDIHAAMGWMKKIAFHKSMDYFRRQEKDNILWKEEIEENENLDIPDNISIPEEIMERQELQQIVQELLGKLEDEQQWILKAYYFEDCKVKEIAQQMGIPENTVKTKLVRARGKLKELVEGLEKQQGIRLRSIPAAPVLLFLLDLQAEAVTVPPEVSASLYMWIKEELPALANMAQVELTAGKTLMTGASSNTSGQVGNVGIHLAGIAAKKWVVGGIVVLLAGAVAVPTLLKQDKEQEQVVTTEAVGAEQTEDIRGQSEAANTQQPEETSSPVEQESELIAYYHEVYDQMCETHEWPKVSNNYTSCEGALPVSNVENDLAYTVMDVDTDGQEEFVVCVMHAMDGNSERQLAVYKYQENTKDFVQLFGMNESLYGESAEVCFYANGGVALFDGQDAKRPSVNIYAYDAINAVYAWKGSVTYWSDTPENQDLFDVFPKDIDEDNDGVVWRSERADVPEGVSPFTVFDKEGYDEWRKNNLNEEEKIDFTWTLFSEGWKTKVYE